MPDPLYVFVVMMNHRMAAFQGRVAEVEALVKRRGQRSLMTYEGGRAYSPVIIPEFPFLASGGWTSMQRTKMAQLQRSCQQQAGRLMSSL